MKVRKTTVKPETKVFNVSLEIEVLDLIAKHATAAGLSRKRLVELILTQVVRDPKFVLEV